jgi:hypothetical protein
MSVNRPPWQQSRLLTTGYLLTVFMLALSGFAQMPIFKRYYIADIPGLGWLAQFYVTHLIHYIGAAILLGLAAYFITRYFLQRAMIRLTVSGYLRLFLMAGIILTGILRVIKNFPGYYLSSGMIILLDLCHVALVVFFLLAALYCMISSKKWISSRLAA